MPVSPPLSPPAAPALAAPAAAAPRLAAHDILRPSLADDGRAAVEAWAAHVAAGRIGRRDAPDPARRARIARTEALIAAGRRTGIW